VKIAIVSDLHANWQAWTAALLDIRSLGADSIVCLGDIVGYGPNPDKLLESVHANVDHMVLGNHDAATCGKLDPALFTENAEQMIYWTRERLNRSALRFLESAPLSLSGDFFRCAHGDFDNPAAFQYVFDPDDALRSFKAVPEQLLFVGHTHNPAIHVSGSSGVVHSLTPQDFALEPGKRYLVNVGSIGQPRHKSTQATYCLLDTDEKSVYWRSIPFDIDAYVQAMEAAGISPDACDFLQDDPRRMAAPLRETVSFSPPHSPTLQVQNSVEVENVLRWSRKAANWRRTAVITSAVCALLIAGALLYLHRFRERELLIPASPILQHCASSGPTELLCAPDAPIQAGLPIPGWDQQFGDAKQQSVQVLKEESGLLFRLASDTARREIRLISQTISATAKERLTLEGSFRKHPGTQGSALLVVSLSRIKPGDSSIEYVDHYVVKEPLVARKDGWMTARQTFTVPGNTTSLTVSIRATINGTLDVKNVSLQSRDAASSASM
jgi:predicted phosphodiesterase